MSFSGGVYTLPGLALVTGEVVSATENNQFRNDVAGAFNLTMLRNGTSTATANLPMGGYKLTGLGAPSTNGDSLAYGAAAVVTTLTSTSLTATRVPYAGTGGLLQDASTFTFDGTTLTAGGFSTSGNISAATATVSGNITVSGGTANGVAYLNGSKVLTTGSALTFDGTNLGVGGSATCKLQVNGSAFITGTRANPTSGSGLELYQDGSNCYLLPYNRTSSAYMPIYYDGSYQSFLTSGSEQMRLTSTGLGIGTSSPSSYSSRAVIVAPSATQALALDVVSGYNTTLQFASNGSAKWFLQNLDTSNAFRFYDATASAERMRIDSSGNLLVGKTITDFGTDGIRLEGAGTIAVTRSSYNCMDLNRKSDGVVISFSRSGTGVGAISITTSTTTYNTSSDYRLKENVQPMQNALATVAQLNPVTYTWKADGSDGQGFIAHELQAVVPDCVTGEKDGTRIEEYEITPAVPAVYEEVVIPAVLDEEGNVVEAEKTEQKLVTAEVPAVMGRREVPVYQGIDTSFLVATLTKAIQELAAKVDAQQAEIDALKNTAA